MSRQEMTAAERARVTTERKRGLTAAQWGALSASEQGLREAEALVRVRGDTRLGDPALIDSGPRAGTRDAARLTLLVNAANRLFDRIATGAVDMHIRQVFGAANVATAKTRYANARTRMNALHASGDIVTDRSGYNAEAELGGLTNSQSISIAPDVMDNPTSRESIITFLHESMHAGNPGVVGDDGGYIERKKEFVRAQEADKIANAAHYEVVPRRMLGMGAAGFAYPGVTFTPGVLAPPVGVGVAPPPAPAGAPVVSLSSRPSKPPISRGRRHGRRRSTCTRCSCATTALPPTGPATSRRSSGCRPPHGSPTSFRSGRRWRASRSTTGPASTPPRWIRRRSR